MKVINNPSMPGACSERQVLLYPTDWEDPLPETMEDIRISIVNDRASGSKREREEVTAVTPCAKRSRQAVFSCSTPVSSGKWANQSETGKEHPDSPAWHLLKEDDQLDDSLLEPSDNEDDSELFLTLDEINTLLGEDDNDSCYAAEPLQKYNEETTCVVTFTPSESENNGENGGASPCQTLDSSDTLVEESECEGDIGNYAAMPPSPSHLAISHVEVTKPNQSSVCNVKSHHESPTAKTVIASNLPTPLSKVKQVSAFKLPSSLSLKRPLQPHISYYGLAVAEDWTEDPDIVFDTDIDNLLAISPGAASSLEDNGVELATITTKGNSSVKSNSKSCRGNVKSDQANAACSDTSDAAQHLSPLSLNTSGLPKGHHHPLPEPKPLKESLPFTASSIVTAEPKVSTELSGAEETKGIQNVESTSRPTDPTTSANGSQSKVVGSSGPKKGKPLIAVAALPRQSFRESLSGLKREKDNYFYQVEMHINGQGESTLEDPFSELASLLNQISQQNQNWQHPSNLTKRNHPRDGRKQPHQLTLNQWAKRNGGLVERFKNIPDIFQRSPVPDALPSGSS